LVGDPGGGENDKKGEACGFHAQNKMAFKSFGFYLG